MSGSNDPNVNELNTQFSNPGDNTITGNSGPPSPFRGSSIMAISGYALIMSSVACFFVAAYVKFRVSLSEKVTIRYETWLDFFQAESTTILLIIIAIVAAMLGKSLLTTVQLADARTIPIEDLPLIRQAVMSGTAEPVDQYVRLRSLTGISGAFTKVGITGLPLTTVLLTLVFSVISLLPLEQAPDFLDLAKLTLGAFIGSFVQRGVDQRRTESKGGKPTSGSASSDLPV